MWFIIRLGVAHSTMMYIIRNNNTNPMFVVWLLAFSWAFVCAPCISWYGNLFILLITADVLVEFPRVPEQWMYYPCSCNSSRLSRYNIVFFPWHTWNNTPSCLPSYTSVRRRSSCETLQKPVWKKWQKSHTAFEFRKRLALRVGSDTQSQHTPASTQDESGFKLSHRRVLTQKH